MRVTGIGWLGVLTENYEEALHFFSEILGLSLEHRDEAKVLAHFWLPSGQLLEVFGPSNRQRKEKYRWFTGPEVGFEVEDVGVAYQEMVARGVRFITEVEIWEDHAWAHFLGPEDTLFGIQKSPLSYPEKSGKILSYSWAGMVVHDLDGAVSFFEKVMEMPLSRRGDEREFAHFRLPAGHLFEIFGPNNSWSQLMSRITIAFEVEDVRQTRVDLEEKGVEFITDVVVTSIGEEFTYFRGPDGYLYELWKQPKPATT